MEKETINLLQISDDSKSISDLDLPININQRKRKIRRKTRPKLKKPTNEDPSNKDQCNRLIIWIAIFLTCCWLLTLSYMIAVIHSENSRLKLEVKKFSLTSQNLPEALQKWHATKKFLEQNQTAIYGRLADIQHNLENLSADYLSYKQKIKEKNDYSRDQKFVADFGAKIEAINVDVEGLKSHFSELQKSLVSSQDDIVNFKNNFTEIINNTKFPSTYEADANNCTKEIKQLEQITFDRIKSVAFNLSLINDTSSQDAKHIYKELDRQKKELEQLQDNFLNTTTHIKSIESYCEIDSDRTATIKNIEENVKQEIQDIRNETARLRNMIEERTVPQSSFIDAIENSPSAKLINPTLSEQQKPIKMNLNLSGIAQNDQSLQRPLPSTKSSQIPKPTAVTTTSTTT